MTWISKLASWGKKNGGTIASVGLGVAGFVAGLAAPGVGAAIGKIADKIGNKASEISGVGDGKPGVFGIGDGLPGLFGIGTGKAKEALVKMAVDRIKALQAKASGGAELTPPEKLELADAKKTAEADMKKEGINPLILVGGGLLALFAFGGNSRR